MKKIILSAVAVLAISFANAQDKKSDGPGFSKGDVFVTGAVGISSSKTGDFKTSDLTVSPRVAYFMSDNIAFGLALGFGSQKIDAGASATNSQTSFGAFGRYYATPSSKFSLFAQLGLDITSNKYEWYTDPTDGSIKSTDFKDKGFSVAFKPGFHYFVSENFALETSIAVLDYSSNDNGGSGADKTNTFDLGVDLRSVMFGLTYKF